MARPFPFVAAAAILVLAATTGHAADPARVCSSKQLKCVSKLAKSLFKCESKAAKAGTAVDPACTQKALDKFENTEKGCIAKAESKGGCRTTGLTSTLKAEIESLADSEVAYDLNPEFFPDPVPGGNLCVAKKYLCVAKKVASVVKCRAKASKKGEPVDPDCLQKAQDKFDGGSEPAKGCFAKLEAKGGCLTTGDLVEIDAVLDEFDADSACSIDADFCPPTTTTSTTTTTLSGPCLVGRPHTVLDTCTELEWMKQDTAVGSGVNPLNLHDVDNVYQWAGECSIGGALCQPNASAAATCAALTGGGAPQGCAECGPAEGDCEFNTASYSTSIWHWLDVANAVATAGHDDWRFPTSAGPALYPTGEAAEIESIIDLAYVPRIDPIFGPTVTGEYHTASTRTVPDLPDQSWSGIFWAGPGPVGSESKLAAKPVRAVRGGDVCSGPGDCVSANCGPAGVCLTATCIDGLQNQDETDIDCGGLDCPVCSPGQACAVPADCDSENCVTGTCQVASCGDGVLNQDETDVDCGGATCGGCGAQKLCLVGGDCAEGVCGTHSNGVKTCRRPHCSDAVQNGSETDLDCGGAGCGPCEAGRTCAVGSDCESEICTGSECQSRTCSDSVKNGLETDVDCGGPCDPCPFGGRCDTDADCAIFECRFQKCGCEPGYYEFAVKPDSGGWPGGTQTICKTPGCCVTVANPSGPLETGNNWQITGFTGYTDCPRENSLAQKWACYRFPFDFSRHHSRPREEFSYPTCSPGSSLFRRVSIEFSCN